MSVETQYDTRDTGEENGVDSAIKEQDISPEAYYNIVAELKLIQRTSNEYRDKLTKAKDENDHMFNSYRVVKEESCRKDTVIEELRSSLTQLTNDNSMKINQSTNRVENISKVLIVSLQNKLETRLTRTRGFFVVNRWRSFVGRNRTERRSRSCNSMKELLIARLRYIFSHFITQIPLKLSHELIQTEKCFIDGRVGLPAETQTEDDIPSLSTETTEVIYVNPNRNFSDVSIQTGVRSCVLNCVSDHTIIPPPVIDMVPETYLVVSTVPESTIPETNSHSLVDRMKRQRVVIRLLNKRMNRLEKFRQRKRRRKLIMRI